MAYTYGYNKSLGLLVGINSGKNADADRDVEDLIRSVKTLETEGGGRADAVGFILLIQDDYPRPNANVRKRLANARDTSTVPFLFALVTSSMMARGVAMALDWVSPPPKTYQSSAHPDFATAVRWVEEKRRMKLPVLQELYLRALQRIEGGP